MNCDCQEVAWKLYRGDTAVEEWGRHVDWPCILDSLEDADPLYFDVLWETLRRRYKVKNLYKAEDAWFWRSFGTLQHVTFVA